MDPIAMIRAQKNWSHCAIPKPFGSYACMWLALLADSRASSLVMPNWTTCCIALGRKEMQRRFFLARKVSASRLVTRHMGATGWSCPSLASSSLSVNGTNTLRALEEWNCSGSWDEMDHQAVPDYDNIWNEGHARFAMPRLEETILDFCQGIKSQLDLKHVVRNRISKHGIPFAGLLDGMVQPHMALCWMILPHTTSYGPLVSAGFNLRRLEPLVLGKIGDAKVCLMHLVRQETRIFVDRIWAQQTVQGFMDQAVDRSLAAHIGLQSLTASTLISQVFLSWKATSIRHLISLGEILMIPLGQHFDTAQLRASWSATLESFPNTPNSLDRSMVQRGRKLKHS